VDGLNPAVLSLIASTVRAAHQYGKWVGVCGGIAGDPQAVPLLLGLGVDEFSVSLPTIPRVKAQIRTLGLADCQDLAQEALRQDSAAAVRALCPSDEDLEASTP
jgi:phosphocarrier protein FPr